MTTSSVTAVLQQLEATEANLSKLERFCREISNLIPDGVSFGSNSEYEDQCRFAAEVLKHLPKIDGWKPELTFHDLDDIAQCRFDAMEIGELSAQISIEQMLEEPERQLREYRFRFNQKRRHLINAALAELIDLVDKNLREVAASSKYPPAEPGALRR